MYLVLKRLITPVLFIALPSVSIAQQNIQLSRKYRKDEISRYRMTTNVVHNGKWQSTIVAICELRTVTDSTNIPYEEVKWISKKLYTAKDTTDKSSQLDRTLPYRISLHPNGKLDIPPIRDAEMTGEITDFNTFFVAISPKLGIGSFQKPGDKFTKPENVQGNFANGKDILKGEDCLAVTSTLLSASKEKAVIQTDFQPPSINCLNYYSKDMNQPVAGDTINNFQMVRAASGKVNLFYGREYFLITSTVRTKDGKLQQASMTNALRLNLKLNCSSDYNDCQNTFPFSIYRTISLELLPTENRNDVTME